MHYKLHLALLGSTLCFFFLGVSPALANTTVLSTNPSYGAQPFSYYCQPYKLPFQSGYHYVATNGGSCVYSVPSSVTGGLTIALYKGTPGNATFVSGDALSGAPTLVQENSTGFGAPAQDQNYFAVVYGASTPGDASLFDASFRTGSSTNTLPPSNDYAIVQWKWGAKPTSEYVPVIIVPGILESWEKNGTWVLDPILHSYDNLIDTFEANGYVQDKTLFTLPYDWEEPNEVTASLLAQKIQSVKQTCGCSHVDLIAHSMGGLVALQYIEGSNYQNDVDQLFLVATPLMGAPKAYLAWEGGEVDFSDPVTNAFMQTDFWIQAEENGYTNAFDYISKKPIVSIQELLPVYDYLFDSNSNELFYPKGYPVNGFLESLVKGFTQASNAVRLDTILADDGQDNTTSGFVIEPSTELPKWADGQPTQVIPNFGDGVVPRASIENLVGTADQEFDGIDHIGVVSSSTGYIFQTLNNKAANPILYKTYSPVLSFIRFSLESPVDMEIVAPDGKRLGKDFSSNTELDEIPDAFYSGFNNIEEYAIILNPLPGTYQVNTIGTGSGGKYTIVAGYFNGTTTTEAELVGTTTPGQIIDHTAIISSTSTVATLSRNIPVPPAETQAPVITITSPTTKQYTHLDTIKIAATITDQSPIASTTYTFDGKVVASSTPISLATAPLGTSTVAVFATDTFGNTGSSSVSFQIVVTSESCKADIALAYKNKWISKKAIYDSLVADCDKLSPLFTQRDTWNKIPLPKRDKKTQQSLAGALASIESVCEDIGTWIKDKSNTKDAVQLLDQNLQWFKNH